MGERPYNQHHVSGKKHNSIKQFLKQNPLTIPWIPKGFLNPSLLVQNMGYKRSIEVCRDLLGLLIHNRLHVT